MKNSIVRAFVWLPLLAVSAADLGLFRSTDGLFVAEGAFADGSAPRQLNKTEAGVLFSVDERRQKAPCERYVIHVPKTTVPAGATIKFTLRFGSTCGILSGIAGIRVKDTSGEIFHYFPDFKIRAADGTTEFYYTVDEKTPIKWGGDGDGKFGGDSVSLVAVTFSVDAGNAQTDHVEMLRLETCRRPIFTGEISAEVDTGNPLHLVRDASESPVLVLRSRSDAPRRWRGKLAVRDFYGQGSPLTVDVVLPAKGRTRIPVPRPDRFGHYRIEGELSSEGGTARVDTAFAVLPRRHPGAKMPMGSFRMGVNFHSYSGYDEASRKIAEEALVALGAKIVRGSVGNFRQVQPNRGEWKWDKPDRIVSELDSLGIAIHAIVFSPPKWSIPEETRMRAKGKRHAQDAPPRLDAYAEYLERFTRRYGRKIDYYEIGNEWDTLFSLGIMTADEAIALQKTAYRTIKSICPEACVIHNGWCGADFYADPKRKAAAERFLTGARGFYDRHVVHIHRYFDVYEKQLDKFFFPDRVRLGLDGNVPWYSDETALSSGIASEECVAATVWKKILHAQAMGSVDYIWYNLRASGPNANERGYGLMERNFTPRPSYAAFSALESVISGLVAERPIERKGYRRIYRLKGIKDGASRIVYAGWDTCADPKPLHLKLDAGTAEIVDLMGNSEPVLAQDGIVEWKPGRFPSALVVNGSTSVVDADRPQASVKTRLDDWKIELERAVGPGPSHAPRVALSSRAQRFSVLTPEHARCETLTDGTNVWKISVETTATKADGGLKVSGRIKNSSDGWRVIGFSGPAFAVAGVEPETMSLYVPEGLGKRVNPVIQGKVAGSLTDFRPEKWQNSRWLRMPSGGLFFGTGLYPGAMGLVMPFIALSDGVEGIYLGRHDPDASVVRLELECHNGQAMLARSVHSTPIAPGSFWKMPETACLRFSGDWKEACRIYRSWFDTVHQPVKAPAWVRAVTGWLLTIMRQQNEEVIWKYSDMDKLCDIADANGLDMIGLFGWTQGGHDHLYPEYHASDEMGGAQGLKDAIALAHRRGKRVCLYANGQLQQVEATDFWREQGWRIAMTDENGELYIQKYPKYKDIPKYKFALGCLHSREWRDCMMGLARQACSFGADGILYDQLGMTRPLLCYGSGHGHSVPANGHELERPSFLREIQREASRLNASFALMTEGLHDSILDSISCFHGCETGCFQARLSWEEDFTKGADNWTRAFVHDADSRFKLDPGENTVFPELFRYAFPEISTTVRIPSPLVDRTMVNWTLLYGLRHDIELRYADDRRYALDGIVPLPGEGYPRVSSPPDIKRMNNIDRRDAYAYLRAANAFQRRHSKFLCEGVFADMDGIELVSPPCVMAKRYRAADGESCVIAWNLGSVPVNVLVMVDGRPAGSAEEISGPVDKASPIDANMMRIFFFGR